MATREEKADGNTISYELYACLSGMSLIPTHAHFKDYSGHVTPALGLGTLKLFVDELTCDEDKFFVTQPKVQDVPLILGRTYKYYFNWTYHTVHCQEGAKRVWVDLIQPTKPYGIKVEPPLTLAGQTST